MNFHWWTTPKYTESTYSKRKKTYVYYKAICADTRRKVPQISVNGYSQEEGTMTRDTGEYPLLTIFTPAYNRQELLKRALSRMKATARAAPGAKASSREAQLCLSSRVASHAANHAPSRAPAST